MASTEEIQKIMKEIEKVHVEKIFKTLNETTAGIGAALRILYEQGGSTTSGRLCDLLGVSSARVAVLLKTMAAKGLIKKDKNVLDARVTVVTLTSFGEETIQKIRDEIYKQINRVIDHVGFQRLEEYIKISKEIAAVVEPLKVMF
ncbi:MAG TPA: winged helix DNA-binding protein [Bacillota bacterium]|nr:winged helix DNA-binding protein [Bacillota bacterium]HOK69008.1 winged helix DNA-binding protein [Bacillota bacterium]HPP85783.1 winged helix DNA-binding protein [Bacillota bacterium]